MKLVVIGHRDAVRGFALVGAQGHVAGDAEEVNAALDAALGDATTGIILITEDAAALVRERIHRLTTRTTIPLIMEIPGPGGPPADRQNLNEIIQRTTGIQL